MRMRSLVNNWTSIWRRAHQHKEWLVPSPSGGMGHGTVRKQRGRRCGTTRAGRALWLWAPRWEGKHCPGRGEGARFSQWGDSGRLPLITRSALTVLWGLIVLDCGWPQHPASHLLSRFSGPATSTLSSSPGGGLVRTVSHGAFQVPAKGGEEFQLWVHFYYYTEMDILITERRTVLALIRRHFIISGWGAKFQDLPEDLSKGLAERSPHSRFRDAVVKKTALWRFAYLL